MKIKTQFIIGLSILLVLITLPALANAVTYSSCSVRGDMNSDGLVNCEDERIMVDSNLGKIQAPLCSDLNNNGQYADIGDVQTEENILHNKGIVCDSSSTPVPTNTIKDALRLNEPKTYKIGVQDYEISLAYMSDSEPFQAKFSINGEITKAIREGESATVNAGTITATNLIKNEREKIAEITFTPAFVYERGDFNFDGKVDCEDAQIMMDANLGRVPSPKFSDLNGDGKSADIGDMQVLENILHDKGIVCNPDPTHIPANTIKDALRSGETKTYTVNNREYEISLAYMSDSEPFQAKFSINGEITKAIREGESATVNAGTITATNLIKNEREKIAEITFTSSNEVTTPSASTTSLRFEDDDIVATPGSTVSFPFILKDSHPKKVCVAYPCIQTEYTYYLNVEGLPFPDENIKISTSNPNSGVTPANEGGANEGKVYLGNKKITLSAGDKLELTLVIKIPKETSINKAQPITEKPIPDTPKEEKPILAIPKEKVENTATVQVYSIKEKVQENKAGSATSIKRPYPIESTKPIEPAKVRKYAVAIVASLNGEKVAKDNAELIVKEPSTTEHPLPIHPIPPFPTETYTTISLVPGWNLITLPSSLKELDVEQLPVRKMLGFVYLKEDQKYVSLKEAANMLGAGLDDYLAKNSFWVYSYQPYTLKAKISNNIDYHQSLYKGWNLLPIIEDMTVAPPSNMFEGCTIEKSYLWDKKQQGWKSIDMNKNIDPSQLYMGIAIKLKNDCYFKGPIVTLTVPNFPD